MKIGTKYTMHIKKFPDKMEGEDQHLMWSPYMRITHMNAHTCSHTQDRKLTLTVHIYPFSRTREFHATETMKRLLNPL